MNDFEQQLRDKWNQINYYNGGSLKISLEHKLEWYVGYFTQTQKAIIILSNYPTENIESSKSILATCNMRQDGKYAISFSLIAQNQEDVFITMCSDIIRFSSGELDEEKALKSVVIRYKQWIRLLEHQHSVLLSSVAQKGLIGELLYLKEIIEKGVPIITAVEGWVGPNGADQDFIYEDGWHEIKTTGVASTEITISSVEQLGCQETGELVVFKVDKCAPEKAGAFSLYSLVHRLIFILNNSPDAVELFIEKLNLIGYIDLQDYDKQKYLFYSRKVYIVDKSFPRLCRSALPTEMVNCSYILNLPSLVDWEE